MKTVTIDIGKDFGTCLLYIEDAYKFYKRFRPLFSDSIFGCKNGPESLADKIMEINM